MTVRGVVLAVLVIAALLSVAVPVCHADHEGPRLQTIGLLVLVAGLAIVALADERKRKELEERLEEQGTRLRQLNVDYTKRIAERDQYARQVQHLVGQLEARPLELIDVLIEDFPNEGAQ